MAEPNPLAGMPLAASLANNMNDSLQWMSRLWSGAAAGTAGSAAGVPSMLMPTFDPAELEKRISDLKTVAHWLDMNRTLLQSTIQTLEMQRNAIVAMQTMAQAPGAAAAQSAAASAKAPDTASAPPGAAPPFDPAAWWNVLQDQFARVAASAMAEPPPPESAPAPATPKAAGSANRKSGS